MSIKSAYNARGTIIASPVVGEIIFRLKTGTGVDDFKDYDVRYLDLDVTIHSYDAVLNEDEMTLDYSPQTLGGTRRTQKVRKQVIFSGHVQGVGFRATTRQLSIGLAVEGIVRNLEDGSVRLRVEAREDQFNTFIDRIKEAMRDNITGLVVTDFPGDFDE